MVILRHWPTGDSAQKPAVAPSSTEAHSCWDPGLSPPPCLTYVNVMVTILCLNACHPWTAGVRRTYSGNPQCGTATWGVLSLVRGTWGGKDTPHISRGCLRRSLVTPSQSPPSWVSNPDAAMPSSLAGSGRAGEQWARDFPSWRQHLHHQRLLRGSWHTLGAPGCQTVCARA